jgi:hypothetical protein
VHPTSSGAHVGMRGRLLMAAAAPTFNTSKRIPAGYLSLPYTNTLKQKTGIRSQMQSAAGLEHPLHICLRQE